MATSFFTIRKISVCSICTLKKSGVLGILHFKDTFYFDITEIFKYNFLKEHIIYITANIILGLLDIHLHTSNDLLNNM